MPPVNYVFVFHALDVLVFTLPRYKTTSIEKHFHEQVGILADPDHHRRIPPANSAGEQGLWCFAPGNLLRGRINTR
jgi:hypothetical protein